MPPSTEQYFEVSAGTVFETVGAPCCAHGVRGHLERLPVRFGKGIASVGIDEQMATSSCSTRTRSQHDALPLGFEGCPILNRLVASFLVQLM
jgi:hypothetical protein